MAGELSHTTSVKMEDCQGLQPCLWAYLMGLRHESRDQPRPDCWPPAGATTARFVHHKCQSVGCDRVNSVDGIELGLLRRSKTLAFAHELLWDWAHRVSTAGESWHAHWRAAVTRCAVSDSQKNAWLFRYCALHVLLYICLS